MPWISETAAHLSRERILQVVRYAVAEARRRISAHPRRVLLLPPDITRMHSGCGWITEAFYQVLAEESEVHVIPTLGQHEPHSREQNQTMFGSIPHQRIHSHDWRNGVNHVGEISADYVRQATQGAADWAIPIWLNRMLLEQPWDLIIHIGHVVPHEVLGFANHNKNYFIGLGGKDLICAAHMAAACCGIENNLGNLLTPLRRCFNKAEDEFLGALPDFYVQVVLARDPQGRLVHTGIHVGDDLETYLSAARQSRDQNITVLEEPLSKVVCVMQEDEFFSTWVANKAIYRTRMALADDGELLILAPGLKRFGEQPEVDALIRKYGYAGTPEVLARYRVEADLQDLAHAAAHLIHGSTEGRFRVRYAPGHLSQRDVETVKFEYADLPQMLARYAPDQLREGFNNVAGERIYFIPTPSAGLWATAEKLHQRPSGFGQDTG
jgi:nickel-dependent lactate racemase